MKRDGYDLSHGSVNTDGDIMIMFIDTVYKTARTDTEGGTPALKLSLSPSL